jgi:hypothetical protein
LAIAKSFGYNVRGKDLSFANGEIEIRRESKIDPEMENFAYLYKASESSARRGEASRPAKPKTK